MSEWGTIKMKFLNMTVEEKRKYYKCGDNFKTINDIVDWGAYNEAKPKLSVVNEHSPVQNFPLKKAKFDKIANLTDTTGDPLKQNAVYETSVTSKGIPNCENTNTRRAEPSVTGDDIPKIDDSTSSENKKVIEDIADPPVEAKPMTGKNIPKSGDADEDMSNSPVTAEPSVTGKIDDLSSNENTKADDPPMTENAFPTNDVLNRKISLFTGDITCLEIDAIVNAANNALVCGGGVDFAIHGAAGRAILKAECWDLDGCDTGNAEITGGYKLPAKYVIHAVGPKGEYPELLSSCYKKSMDLLKEHKLETIAFPCISTGIYGYPNENAAAVALETIRKWLDEDDYSSNVKRVIFCLFVDADIKIYQKLMPKYFPL